MKILHFFLHGLFSVFFIIPLNDISAQNNFNLKVGPQPDGSVLVPSNQLLRPAGDQIELPGRPVDILLNSGGNFLFVKNMKSLDLIRLSDKSLLQSLSFPNKAGASVTGICASKDNRKIYLSEGSTKILIARFAKNNTLSWDSSLVMPNPAIGGDPSPCGLALNSRENRLVVTLSRSNSLAVVNPADQSVSEIPVGMAPYDVILHSDTKAYVTNWGGRRPVTGEPTYNSSGSQVLVDPRTGVASSGSVSVVDLKLKKELKEINVGLHPSGMILSPDKSLLYVACSNSDKVFVIDTRKDVVKNEISVHMNKQTSFGSAPNALAISPDGKYLYVANGTQNAICVIETGSNQVNGYIPTGWYPGEVIMNKTGNQLYVANVKGIGSRNKLKDKNGYNSHDHMGSISVIPIPGKTDLQKMTETVVRNNTPEKVLKAHSPAGTGPLKVAVPQITGQVSQFKHVVYIIKENRTYDQIFGDMKQGDGDTSLVHFGREITPNHHKLAETFVLMDNFYCSGVLSADGHQWADEAYATDYLEKSFGDFTRSYPYDGDDALAYASSGFIWDNVLRKGLTFRNYGEFANAEINPKTATYSDILQDFQKGTKNVSIKAKANLEQIAPYTCPTFIGFPIKVPDAYRASEFIKEFREYEKTGNFPNFIIMLLPADHTSGTRPGQPTPRAAVADNDLALGQIIETISNSKFWKETCIFVTEDDPQAGLDHVDGHRTVGMVVSPYTKRREVVSTYYSQINMVRTMENILGIPPMNQLDNSAEPMSDCFYETPDFTPYKAAKSNIPLDELNPPLSGLSGKQLSWAKKSLEQDLDDYDRIDEDTFNRIIWHAMKGWDRPYPDLSLK